MSLNLHLLRMFAAVVERKLFKAAEIPQYQPARDLEGRAGFELQVGCRLLNRTPKGVVPTPAIRRTK